KETYVFDLDLAYILDVVSPEWTYEQVAKYPAVRRDIAFVLKQDVVSGDVQKIIEETGQRLVQSVEVFDLYVGDNLEADEKSIAYHIHSQDKEKTLTDDVVDQAMEATVEKVTQAFNAHVRAQ